MKLIRLIAVPLFCLFVGTGVSHAALGDNWAIGPDDDIRMKASSTTGDTTDIDITVPAANLVNVLTGNLKVGNASPSVTLDGEDAYIEGTLEVNGTLTATTERVVDLDIMDSLVVEANVTGGTDVAIISSSTTPGLALTSTGETPFIEWADGEETPIQKKFKVPTDYSSGGAFRVLVGKDGTGDPPAIDFEVFVDSSGAAADTSATDQSTTELASSNGDDSPEQIELSVTTDFASLAATNYVTVNFWRDNTDTSTEALELYYAEFYYTARQ